MPKDSTNPKDSVGVSASDLEEFAKNFVAKTEYDEKVTIYDKEIEELKKLLRPCKADIAACKEGLDIKVDQIDFEREINNLKIYLGKGGSGEVRGSGRETSSK